MSIAILPSTQDGLPSPPPYRTGQYPIRSFLTRGNIGRLLRQAYGQFKLLIAPHEARLLRSATPGSALAKHIAAAPYLSMLAAQPFVCSQWSSRLRMRRMMEHCTIIDQLGRPFNVAGHEYVEVLEFHLGGNRWRLTLDKPDWLSCDGMVAASLWVDHDRVVSISFTLSDADGVRTAYVGGIQGRRDDGALDQNRALTKAAHGMRPRDLAFDLFRMLLPHMQVAQLLCVSDSCRYQLTRWALLTIGVDDTVKIDYDQIWEDRGGVPGTNGFFIVPLVAHRRDSAEIPAKKRSMYTRRYAFLDELNNALVGSLARKLPFHPHGAAASPP